MVCTTELKAKMVPLMRKNHCGLCVYDNFTYVDFMSDKIDFQKNLYDFKILLRS